MLPSHACYFRTQCTGKRASRHVGTMCAGTVQCTKNAGCWLVSETLVCSLLILFAVIFSEFLLAMPMPLLYYHLAKHGRNMPITHIEQLLHRTADDPLRPTTWNLAIPHHHQLLFLWAAFLVASALAPPSRVLFFGRLQNRSFSDVFKTV